MIDCRSARDEAASYNPTIALARFPSTAMRLLPLLVVYCAWALPGQYKKRRRRKKKKKPERVQIHQADLCTGCLSFVEDCLLYTSPSPRDRTRSRMPSSA